MRRGCRGRGEGRGRGRGLGRGTDAGRQRRVQVMRLSLVDVGEGVVGTALAGGLVAAEQDAQAGLGRLAFDIIIIIIGAVVEAGVQWSQPLAAALAHGFMGRVHRQDTVVDLTR